MDVTFGDAALAALCNSERRLAQKWGAATGRAVGRRLLELSATDFEAIPRLPHTRIRTEDSGETVINFGGGDIIELSEKGKRPMLIPFTEAAVPEIDFEKGTILVEPFAAGLIADEDDNPLKGGNQPKKRPKKS